MTIDNGTKQITLRNKNNKDSYSQKGRGAQQFNVSVKVVKGFFFQSNMYSQNR